MPQPNPDLIPARRPISSFTADRVAQSTFDRLVAGWGLVNVEKIVSALGIKVQGEAKRRKGMEGK